MTEKKWYQSKKFIAFLITELLLAALAIVALFAQKPLNWSLSGFMIACVITMGSIAFGFNGYQAALDKYLRGLPFEKGPIFSTPIVDAAEKTKANR